VRECIPFGLLGNGSKRLGPPPRAILIVLAFRIARCLGSSRWLAYARPQHRLQANKRNMWGVLLWLWILIAPLAFV
jgi:hypothetical protein